MQQATLGTIMLFIAATNLAAIPILIKIAYGAGANTFTVLSVRFVIASVILTLILHYKKISYKFSWKSARAISMIGIFSGMTSLFFTSSIQYLPAALAELLLYTYPVIVTLLSFAIKLEKFNWQKGMAVICCFTGLIGVLGVSSASISPLGVVLGMGAAISISIFIILSNKVLKDKPALIVSAFTCYISATVFVSYSLTSGQLNLQLPLQGWLAMCGIAIMANVIGSVCFFIGLNKVGPANASIISCSEPLMTVIMSAAILGEQFTGMQGLGGLLIMTGILILQFANRKSVTNEKVSMVDV